ncbi:CHAT domain-containing protein [Micromonospora chalcea]|uniref:CHAT domain-containing protein n=1 Tax=Micromonospora chalcea TaxID=1874 RepID=UPI0037F70A86
MSGNSGIDEQDPVRTLAGQQMMLGRQQIAAFVQTNNPVHLDAAIRVWETVLELSRASPIPEVVAAERAAETSFMMRWRLCRGPADLERVLAGREHLDDAPANGPDETILHQTIVAEALQARFDEHGNLADLDEAADRLRQALELCTDDSLWRPPINNRLSRIELTRHIVTDEEFTASIARPMRDEDEEFDLVIRALGYFMRYQAGGPRSDARKAISLYQRAIRVARDTESAAGLELAVGSVHAAVFNRTDSPAELDEAVARYTRAIGALQDAGEFRKGLVLLLNAHTARTEAGAVPADIAGALNVMHHYVDDDRLDSTARSQVWTSISFLLQQRARAEHRREDLTAAVDAARRAVMEADGNVVTPLALSQLATGLALKLELFGEDTEIRDAATVAAQAAEASEDDDDGRVLRHLNAARMWFHIGERDREPEAFDRALALLAAVERTDHELRAAVLLQQQLTCRERLKTSEDPADLDGAIAAGLALWNSPTAQAVPHWIQSAIELGEMLYLRGSMTRTTSDLEATYRVGLSVVSMLPEEDPGLPNVLYRLVALPARDLFTLTDDPDHLGRAVAAATQAFTNAVELDDAAEFCIGLGAMLRDRFSGREDAADDDLRAALGHYESVLARLQPDHADRSRLLVEMATTFRLAFDAGGDLADARAALWHARAAAEHPAVDGDRVRAGAWALCADLTVTLAAASDPATTVDDAVRFGEAAIGAAGDPVGAYPRWVLYRAIALRYIRDDDDADFARAVETLTALAGESGGGADCAEALAHAARLHRLRFDRRREPADLDRAIALLEDAVAAADAGSPMLVRYADELYRYRSANAAGSGEDNGSEASGHAARGRELSERFAADNDPAAGEAAITAWFAAALLDPDRFGPGLAAAASSADNSTADLRMLHGLYFRLATTQGRPDWPKEARMLVELLHQRWRAGLEPYVAEALADVTALLAARTTEPRLALYCADSMFELFTLSGEPALLTAAIGAYMEVRPDPAEPAMSEHVRRQIETARKHVGDPLNGARAAADRANAWFLLSPSAERATALLTATREAAAGAPVGHREHASLLGNVANAALLVAEFTDDARDYADEAVTAARAAADAADNDVLRSKGRFMLAAALLRSVKHTFDAEGAEEALALAAGLFGDPSLDAPARGLTAALLLERLDHTEDADQRDLHRAVQYAREALEALDEDAVNRTAAELLLVRALFRRFFRNRDLDDLAEALQQLGDDRSAVAAGAGRLAVGLEDPASRPPPDVLLAGLDPEAAGQLAEMAAELVAAVDDDDLAEWLLALPLHFVDPKVAPHARQRYLVSSAKVLEKEHPSLALRLLRRAAGELAEADDRDGRSGAAHAWSMIGSISESSEDWNDSFEAYANAVHLYRQIEEPGQEIYRLRDMAIVCSQRGDEPAALTHFDEAIRRAGETGNDELQPELLMLSATSAEPAEAARRVERALALWTASGNRDRAHHGHVSRAMLAVMQHDAAAAVRHAHSAADLAASAEEAEQGYVVVWRTMVANGMYEESRALEEPTADQFRRTGECSRAANALYNYAVARQAAGDVDGALKSFAAAGQEFLTLDDLVGVAAVDGRIAGLHFGAGEYDRAVAGMRTAADRFAAAEKWDKAALGYRNAAALRFYLDDAEITDRSVGDRAAAIADLAKSLEYAERAGDPSVHFSILLVQARLDEEDGQRSAAAERLAEATRLAGGEAVRMAMVEEVKAQLAGSRGALVEQQEALERARDLFERADRPRSAGATARGLALVYEGLGEIRRARSAMQFAIDKFAAEESITTGQNVHSIVYSSPELLEAMRAKLALWDFQLDDRHRSREGLAVLSAGQLAPEQQRLFAAHRAMDATRAAGDLADALRIGQEALSGLTDPQLRSVLLQDLSPIARELGLIELAYDYAADGAELAEEMSLRIAHLRNLGSAARVWGRVDEAVSALRRAVALLKATDRADPSLELDVLNSLACALIDQGGWPEADRVVAKGLDLARSAGRRWSEASLLQSRGNLYLSRQNYEDAYIAYRASIRIQEDLGGDEMLAGAYANLGVVQLRRGRRDEARELTERALLAERRTGQMNGVVLNLLALAHLTEDDESADRHLTEALDISRRNGFQSGVGQALFGIGGLALQRADTTLALARFTEAIGIFRDIGETPNLVMGLLQRSITMGEIGDLPAAVRDAEEADRIQRSLAADQDLPNGPGAAVLDHLVGLYVKTRRGADAWCRVEQSKSRDLLAQLDAEELPAPEGVDRPGDFDAIVNRGGAIGLLGFYLGPSSAVAFFYCRELEEPVAIPRMRLPDTVFDTLRRAHGKPIPVILRLPDENGGDDQVETDMRRLPYLALIRDLLPGIGNDLDLLYLLPHRQMNQIPLHALGPDGDTLVDRTPVAYAPSAAVLRRLLDRPRADKERPSRVLGYAPPEDREALILIERTATDVAAKLGVEPMRAMRATSDQLAGKWNILHLSGHGEFHENDPLGSGIRLADGLLTARKIMRMRIDADLVVLGTCESGLSGHDGAVDAAGLGYALLYAGARCALLTLWPVEADTTRVLLGFFYAHLLAGRPKAAALRQALLDLRKLPGKDQPSVWGAYILLGNAG